MNLIVLMLATGTSLTTAQDLNVECQPLGQWHPSLVHGIRVNDANRMHVIRNLEAIRFCLNDGSENCTEWIPFELGRNGSLLSTTMHYHSGPHAYVMLGYGEGSEHSIYIWRDGETLDPQGFPLNFVSTRYTC